RDAAPARRGVLCILAFGSVSSWRPAIPARQRRRRATPSLRPSTTRCRTGCANITSTPQPSRHSRTVGWPAPRDMPASAPAKPAHIGSLSKAITAVCVARLIDAGRLSFTAPLGTAIPNAFRRYGEPADPRFKAITIEQLLMHRAGLATSVPGWHGDHDMA